ncbi:DUF2231 domain-containing protein [Psychroflexus sediminis]|uniref:Uncharacterized membrane protein n=1 Tax=Psychroflexus sediminis TaxID=470826 RepID=A0A1G7VNV1_9FLAO|nr:DUF2231 domain-containing protein [Psychroflexus sediminis]SDG61496.1 Uncharacterized membrane protein [Psychroflexus sediminis]
MTELPEFWRTEIWHPLVVHFPIALLLVASLFKVLNLFLKGQTWKGGGSVLLLLGIFGVWIAIYTGNLADGIVSRTLCDPTVLEAHENSAYTLAWLFTAAFLLDAASAFKRSKNYVKWLKLIVVILMLIGSGFMVYTGHLGAKLVYQQGAGVYMPSQDCVEFSD